ncbi:hypothetical protein CTI12_AA552040 [Artemisia annua]|uniref:Uncharacterized protein n=1 Tax=Artemisia annua TaxID=35608 RepID=A0A2U1KWQ6_ARTAN|nr:hypothetical protein CTI12_AA552040 [Artemisia annua]
MAAAAGGGSAAMESAATTTLRSVLNRVKQAAERSSRPANQIKVIAVSKKKPRVLNLHLPEDIGWHFIGNLQSNKVKPLLRRIEGVPVNHRDFYP